MVTRVWLVGPLLELLPGASLTEGRLNRWGRETRVPPQVQVLNQIPPSLPLGCPHFIILLYNTEWYTHVQFFVRVTGPAAGCVYDVTQSADWWPVLVSYCDTLCMCTMYCTILYCTVLYCTVLYYWNKISAFSILSIHINTEHNAVLPCIEIVEIVLIKSTI